MRDLALVALGAAVTLALRLVEKWLDSSNEKRIRWDEELLDAYVRFIVAVRAAEQRASRLVRDGETEDPQSNQYVRDKMREESFVIEQISLIGTGPVVQAAKKVDELLRAALEPPVTSNVGISIMTAQSNFLWAVRKELEITNGCRSIAAQFSDEFRESLIFVFT